MHIIPKKGEILLLCSKYCLKFHTCMRAISFYKLSGAGNDFILFDRKENPQLQITPEFARKVCSRRFGIGSDGILFFGDSQDYDFDLNYYNADGSTGVLCGNGARCAIRFAQVSGRMKSKDTKFTVNNVMYSGKTHSNGKVTFNLNNPEDIKLNLRIPFKGQTLKASYAYTGAPHLVINIKDIRKDPDDRKSSYKNMEDIPAYELGKEIRYLETFSPEGVNVNFILYDEGHKKIRTYERGVEDETLACGTGAAASAVTAFLNFNIKPPVTFLTKGGAELEINFKSGSKGIHDLSLTGPAEIVFKGEITI